MMLTVSDGTSETIMVNATSDGEVEIPETFNVTVGDSSLPDGITIPSPLAITITSLDRKL